MVWWVWWCLPRPLDISLAKAAKGCVWALSYGPKVMTAQSWTTLASWQAFYHIFSLEASSCLRFSSWLWYRDTVGIRYVMIVGCEDCCKQFVQFPLLGFKFAGFALHSGSRRKPPKTTVIACFSFCQQKCLRYCTSFDLFHSHITNLHLFSHGSAPCPLRSTDQFLDKKTINFNKHV